MKHHEVKENLKDLKVFSLADVRQFEPSFDRNRLVSWNKKGYITKLRRNRYIFSDLEITDNTLFEISNKIYTPSYISLETALSLYGLIPETVYSLTSVSTRKTKTFSNKLGTFKYQTIAKKLFWGYKTDNNFLIASPEKALLDYMYLNTDIKDEKDFFELRFNFSEYKRIYSKKTFEKYLKIFSNKKLEKRLLKFLKYYENA